MTHEQAEHIKMLALTFAESAAQTAMSSLYPMRTQEETIQCQKATNTARDALHSYIDSIKQK